MQRLGPGLVPLTPLAAAPDDSGEPSLWTLLSPGVDRDLAAAVGRTVLSALTHPQAPRPIDQVTVRGRQAVVVVTALGDAAGRVLVVATPRSRSLALLELLCRRQAAGAALPLGGTGGAAGETRERLEEVEPDARVRSLGAALDGVGPVRAWALRDPLGGRRLHLFLPDGSDVRAAGAFTADLARAFDAIGGRGAFDTVIVRGGAHRMVIRLGASGAAAIVAAVAETRSPGLAHRQVAEIAGAVATA
jgi:hypothetical protein